MYVYRRNYLRAAFCALGLQLLAACGNLPGTSFSVPRWDSSGDEPKTVVEAIEFVDKRQAAYLKEEDDTKNAVQPLDIGLWASGLVAVGSVIYGGPADLAKGAALSGAGLFGARDYYSFASRSAAYSDGADALGCVVRTGGAVKGVDGAISEWKRLQPEALLYTNEQALTIRRLAPRALDAAAAIRRAARQIDAAIAQKIEMPKAPDMEGIFDAYKKRLAQIEKEKEQNKKADDEGVAVLKLLEGKTGGQVESLMENPREKFNIDAARLLSDTALIEALTEFDQALEQCRLKAA